MLQKLIEETEKLAYTLLETLSDADRKAVWQDLHAMGEGPWIDWVAREAAQGTIAAFVERAEYCQPSSDGSLDPVRHRRMVIAATVWLQGASNLLRACAENELTLDKSYPGLAASIGQIYHRAVVRGKIHWWPFDGAGPFGDDL